jgi:hypothetical protein
MLRERSSIVTSANAHDNSAALLSEIVIAATDLTIQVFELFQL